MLYLYGYDKDLVYQGAESFTAPGSRNITVWYKDIVETMIAGNTNFLLNGANVRYVRIGLYCNAELYAGAANVRFSDIVLSTIRKAAPTAGVVGANSQSSLSPSAVPSSSWTTVDTITPSTDVESYFVDISSYPAITISGSHSRKWRIYDETDGAYYPDVNGIWNSIRSENPHQTDFAFICIGKNVKSHTLRVQLYHTVGSSTNWFLIHTEWGFSPHTHV
jgi:hypothetical protein